MPGGTLASWAALPGLSWLQIVLVVALLDNSILAQDPSKAAGDVGDGTYCQPAKVWVRYADVPGFSGKEFKLNAERNNGRAAMMGIIGMMIHEGLTGNPVWPIPVPPQPGARHPRARPRRATREQRGPIETADRRARRAAVLDIAADDVEKGPARVGSFVLASLGMAFIGIAAAVPEFGRREE